MVNEVALKYFRDHSKYPLDELKKAALGGGCSQADVDEVVALLGLKKEAVSPVKPKVEPKVGPGVVGPGVVGKRAIGGKWMKIAGILGVVFLFLGMVGFILGLLGVPMIEVNEWVGVGLLVLSVIFVLLYFYGFFRMGKAVNSRTMKVAAVMNIAGVILLVVFSVVMVFVVGGSVTSQVDVFGADGGGGGSDEDAIGGWAVLGPAIFVVLFIFIAWLLLPIALIKVGEDIRFAKIAGVLDLITIGLGLIFVGVMTYSFITNPLEMMIFAFVAFGVGFWPLLISGVFSFLSFLVLALKSLALLDGSKKFEQ
jgi:hypothetical protein